MSVLWRLAYKNEGKKVILYGDPLLFHTRTTGWLLGEFVSMIK
jgi:L-cystine uptake protein TcyP (sodium:dicarboxylate symporter family)